MKSLTRCLFLTFFLVLFPGTADEAKTLPELLGFKKEDRLLIINADDAGLSHATNRAVLDAMRHGLVTSATIMCPCPWFPEIARAAVMAPEMDFGVHLTHTCEWKNFRWGPLSGTKTPGLTDKNGYMRPDVKSVYMNATPEEAYMEGRAQIEQALRAGIDVTHIDSHMGAMMFDLRFAARYVELASEYNLPLRVPSEKTVKKYGAPFFRKMLDRAGLIYPDYLVYEKRREGESVKKFWLRMLSGIKPGVTEIFIHPALPADETKSITNSWKSRAAEYGLFTKDADIKRILAEKDIKLIGYRPLRKLQRDKKRPPRKHY